MEGEDTEEDLREKGEQQDAPDDTQVSLKWTLSAPLFYVNVTEALMGF